MIYKGIIVAAGKGLRMGADMPKQYLRVLGRPVLSYTLDCFEAMKDFFQEIILIVPPGGAETCREVLLSGGNDTEFFNKIAIIGGGRERQDSVRNGLEYIKGNSDEDNVIICIHDGVRPLVTPSVIRFACEEAARRGAVVTAVPLKDTLKETDERGYVKRTLPREKLHLIQTPQCFRSSIITAAYKKAWQDGYYTTDDGAVAEYAGYPVKLIPGDPENIKVTTSEDLAVMEAIIRKRSAIV